MDSIFSVISNSSVDAQSSVDSPLFSEIHLEENSLNEYVLENKIIDSNINVVSSPICKMHIEESIEYVFCYGSNSINQLKERLLEYGDIEYHPARLKNYCRIFSGFSKKWFGGIATIVPLKNNYVYGITVKITAKQLSMLDYYEKGYTRNIMKVYFEDIRKNYNVYVYIKNNTKFIELPSAKYMESINRMLNDRYPSSPNNLNRKIKIRKYINKTYVTDEEKIIVCGFWTEKDGFILRK